MPRWSSIRTITCIDCDRSIEATGQKQYRCRPCSKKHRAELQRIRRDSDPHRCAIYGRGLAEYRQFRHPRQAEGVVSAAEVAQLIAEARGLCAYCRAPWELHGGLEIDHVIPINPRPGEPKGINEIGNLAAVCQQCNSRKGNKPLHVWMPTGRREPAPECGPRPKDRWAAHNRAKALDAYLVPLRAEMHAAIKKRTRSEAAKQAHETRRRNGTDKRSEESRAKQRATITRRRELGLPIGSPKRGRKDRRTGPASKEHICPDCRFGPTTAAAISVHRKHKHALLG